MDASLSVLLNSVQTYLLYEIQLALHCACSINIEKRFAQHRLWVKLYRKANKPRLKLRSSALYWSETTNGSMMKHTCLPYFTSAFCYSKILWFPIDMPMQVNIKTYQMKEYAVQLAIYFSPDSFRCASSTRPLSQVPSTLFSHLQSGSNCSTWSAVLSFCQKWTGNNIK